MVILCDAIDGELGGSRLLMKALGDNSSGDPRIIPHIIKPMLWKGDMDDLNLLDARFHAAVGGFSFRNQEISPENFPCEIHRSISLLISQYGCDRIALVGYCWGGSVVQQCLKEVSNIFREVVCGVSVDGVYLDKNYSTLVPAFFMVGFEGVQRYHNIVEEMERVFQEQNPYKIVSTKFREPAYHGVIIRGLYDQEVEHLDRDHDFKNDSEQAIEDACVNLKNIANQASNFFLTKVMEFLQEQLYNPEL